MNSRTHPSMLNRRRFISETAKTACGIGLLGMGLVIYSKQTRSMPATALRPPGAITEEEFSSACIRCGLCVRDCPYGTLGLSKLGEAVVTGTPYFVARKVPCEMCEDVPCVAACPTGALDHSLTNIDDARMGLATLVDHETCLNLLGLRCDVCYRVCPAIDKAITLEMLHNPRSGKHALFIPTVHSGACTGCGKCEYACVLPEAAIKVLPLSLAKGRAAEHYRLGWEEKRKAGGSLVTGEEAHEYYLPKGMEYEHGGRGLINESSETPFSSDPLETLKRGQAELPQ
ncbi:MAG: ferredoxin-type protein NapG [Pseudomonadales bacterium]|nr:ferredoxin-type protein NapG [Pseudomonadales bacterium]